MTFIHGKVTAVSLNGVNLSTFTNNAQSKRSADSHDVTCFGKNAHVYAPGLTDGEGTLSGIYDNTAVTGPSAVFRPLVGAAVVPFVYRPEGAGSAKPNALVSVLVTAYEETSPVADMVTWSATLQFSDSIDDTPQP
jgi:hypothetical protein